MLNSLQDIIARLLYSKYSFSDAYEFYVLVKQASSEFITFPGLFELIVKKVLPRELRGMF